MAILSSPLVWFLLMSFTREALSEEVMPSGNSNLAHQPNVRFIYP